MSNSIKIVWEYPDAAAVTISGGSGAASTAFTVNGSPVTFPYALSADTQFDTEAKDTFTVSVNYSGVEIADTPDAAKVIPMFGNAQVVIRPTFDRNARASLSNAVASAFLLRAHAFPGTAGIPKTNTGLATVTLSAANASTSIASGVQTKPTKVHFRPFGVEPIYGTAFPDTNGWLAQGVYTKTSTPPWGVEFDLDTPDGVFEVVTKGSSVGLRVLVDGSLVTTTHTTIPGDGQGYLVKVAITAGAGQYRVRLEATAQFRFWGIYTAPAASITAPPRRARRFAALGDSFWEPTVSDTTLTDSHSLYGLPQQVAYVTGWDVLPVGSGGTGLVNPGTGGKVKYRDRLSEVTAIPELDGVIVGMSSNDQTYSVAQVLPELQGIVADLRLAGFTTPGQIIVVGPWWKAGGENVPASILAQNDAARDWCTAQGVVFVDQLTPPSGLSGVSTTLSSAAALNATSISIPINTLKVGWWLKIGSSPNSMLRKITGGPTGTGPYTYNFNGGLGTALAAGDTVLEVGESDITTALAARYTGSDGTHPTLLGALFRAKRIVSLLLNKIRR